jgi:hypothetical protein
MALIYTLSLRNAIQNLAYKSLYHEKVQLLFLAALHAVPGGKAGGVTAGNL